MSDFDLSTIFDGLRAVVQYRRKPQHEHGDYGGVAWEAMAAFDVPDLAVKYAAECSGDVRPWEYRTVFLKTFCSQCGTEFGPGLSGYSHCDNHRKQKAGAS